MRCSRARALVCSVVVLVTVRRARGGASAQLLRHEREAGLLPTASPAALRLHRGCEHSVEPAAPCAEPWCAELLPHLLVIGVQKGGTTTLRRVWKSRSTSTRVCVSAAIEPHFFDSHRWQNQTIPRTVLLEYSTAAFQHCHAARPGHVRMEKSPSYFDTMWTPRRVCEAFAAVRRPVAIVLLLREPVARAFSGYSQSRDAVLRALGAQGAADGFDAAVRIDMAVVRACDGLPDAAYDYSRAVGAAARFRQCCAAAVCEAHPRLCGRPWLGCEPSARIDARFGSHVYAPVRRGMYARYLRGWLTYHRADHLRVVDFSRCVSRDALACAEAIGAWAHRVQFGAPTDGGGGAQSVVGAGGRAKNEHAVHLNRASHRARAMANHTRAALREFYAPHNDQLFALLGVAPLEGWSTLEHAALHNYVPPR